MQATILENFMLEFSINVFYYLTYALAHFTDTCYLQDFYWVIPILSNWPISSYKIYTMRL